MKNNLENIKEKTSQIRLTSAEKFAMFENIRQYSNTPVVSPLYTRIWFKKSFAYVSGFIFIAGGAATSFAAESSLPGETLYAVKISINEAVVQALPLSPDTKAKVEINLIDRRMQELEEMIVTNQDTPEKIDLVLNKIDDHKNDLDEHVDILDNSGESLDQVAVLHAKLDTVVNTHLDVLTQIIQEDSVAEDLTQDIVKTTDSDVVDIVVLESTSTLELSEKSENFVENQEQNSLIQKIINFSEEEIKPLIEKNQEDAAQETLEIQDEIRSKIISDAEKNLNIEFDDSIEKSSTTTQ